MRRVFPNCTAKAKGERQVYVGQQLLEARELGGMVVRRPIDRVGTHRHCWPRHAAAAVVRSALSWSAAQQLPQLLHKQLASAAAEVVVYGACSARSRTFTRLQQLADGCLCQSNSPGVLSFPI
jgi:hypothetical protein